MSTTQTKHGAPPLDATFDQVKQLNEELLTATRKVGTLCVDSYEKAVDRTIELELKVAGASQQEWLKTLIQAQAGFGREVAGSCTTAARSLLR